MLRTCLLVSLIALSLSACGNKGPLVLPDPEPAQTPAASDKDKKPPATLPPVSGPATGQH